MACYFNDKKVLPLADFSQTDSFDSRRTANGEKILSPSFALVEKIKGKTVKSTNLIPTPYRKQGTTAGLTFTENADGSVHIKGTLTAAATEYTFVVFTEKFLGKDYSIALYPQINNIYTIFKIYNDGTWVTNLLSSNRGNRFKVWYNGTNWSVDTSWHQGTFDAPADCFTNGKYRFQASIRIEGSIGDVIDTTVYPMLNEGSTALPYTPYFAGLKNATISGIKSTGANLIPFPYYAPTGDAVGLDYVSNRDGSITINGTMTRYSSAYIFAKNLDLEVGKTYTYSTVFSESVSMYGNVQIYNNGRFVRNVAKTEHGRLATFTVTEDMVSNGNYIQVNLYSSAGTGATFEDVVVYPMLNYGTTALPYQPYAESTYQLPESYELGEWDSINPIEKTITRGTKTIVFDGTENWLFNGQNFYLGRQAVNKNGNVGIATPYNYAYYSGNGVFVDSSYVFATKELAISFNNDIEAWKSHLAELANAGNPLTIAYELLESITETVEDLLRGYMAHKDGTETYLAGETDNSKWGAIPEFTLNYPKIMKEGTFNG